jgi:hypothetical protein
VDSAAQARNNTGNTGTVSNHGNGICFDVSLLYIDAAGALARTHTERKSTGLLHLSGAPLCRILACSMNWPSWSCNSHHNTKSTGQKGATGSTHGQLKGKKGAAGSTGSQLTIELCSAKQRADTLPFPPPSTVHLLDPRTLQPSAQPIYGSQQTLHTSAQSASAASSTVMSSNLPPLAPNRSCCQGRVCGGDRRARQVCLCQPHVSPQMRRAALHMAHCTHHTVAQR